MTAACAGLFAGKFAGKSDRRTACSYRGDDAIL